MKVKTTAHFDKNLAKRLKKKPQLAPKLKKQISLLKKDLQHPSLKLHKLKGKRTEEYSFWIEKNLRITFNIINSTILFTDIVTHDQY